MYVYCRWVNQTVELDTLSKYCKPHIIQVDDETCKCNQCETSPQIALGTPVDRLLEQLRSGDGE
jgi:hypothetical protein